MMVRPRFVVALAVAGGVLLAAPPALATPYEHVRFQELGTFTVRPFCGDLRVRITVHDQGVIVGRIAGKNLLLRYTQSHHGGATYTNLATGKTFTFTWNYLNQELRVTDNGDGTLTILSQVPGPEKIFGPDGQLLNTSGGTMRLETVLDHGGTPNDPTDDTFVSETLVSSTGGQPQGEFDFCDAFRTLTG